MKRPRQILYVDANAKVGEVKVYACPLCRDGQATDDLAKLEREREIGESYLMQMKKERDEALAKLAAGLQG